MVYLPCWATGSGRRRSVSCLAQLTRLFNFYQIGQSALRAAAFYRIPERAQRGMVRGYMTRYVMTAVVVAAALKAPWLNAAAVIVPLFYTKIILLILNTRRKGGN